MVLLHCKFILNKVGLLFSIVFDAAEDYQLLFQQSASVIMDNIIDLHHDIFSIMLVIASIVFYLIFIIIWKFRAGKRFVRRNFKFTHHTSLEIV